MYNIPKMTILLHILNVTIGAISIAVLGLVTHSTILKDDLEMEIRPNVKTISMSLLFWPGVGGVVDMLLFIFIWSKISTSVGSVRNPPLNRIQSKLTCVDQNESCFTQRSPFRCMLYCRAPLHRACLHICSLGPSSQEYKYVDNRKSYGRKLGVCAIPRD